MKKTLLTLAIGALLSTGAYADNVTDVLTGSLFTETPNQTYVAYENVTVTSEAVYYANIATGNSGTTGAVPVLQLRSKNSDSGIVSTVSGGKIRKVSLKWHDATKAGRTVMIFGSNKAYTAPSELFMEDEAGTLLGELTIGNEVQEIIPESDFQYFGIRSKSEPLYLTELTIEWEVPAGMDNLTARPAINGVTSFYPSTTVTLSSDEDAAISYYIDTTGEYTAPEKVTEVPEGWLPYSEPFLLDATATVYAVAKAADKDFSLPASQKFTRMEVAEYDNIAALNAAILNGSVVADDNVMVKGKVVISSFAPVSASQNYIFIQDTDSPAATQIYSTSAFGHEYEPGDVLEGVIGVYGVYGNNPQLTATKWLSSYGDPVDKAEVTPTLLEALDFDPASQGNNLNEYVVLKNLPVAVSEEDGKTYMTVGETPVQIYDRLRIGVADMTFDAEKTYTVVGYPIIYKTTKEFFPVEIQEYVYEPDTTEAPVFFNPSTSENGYTSEISFGIDGNLDSDVTVYFRILSGTGVTAEAELPAPETENAVAYDLAAEADGADTFYVTSANNRLSVKDYTLVKAVAVKEGCLPSEVVTGFFVESDHVGVSSIAAESGIDKIYTINGQEVSASSLEKGIYLVKRKDGKVVKMISK